MLITSHILSELDDLVTKVLYMNNGQFLFAKPLEQLMEETGEHKLSHAIAKIMSKKKAETIKTEMFRA